MGEDIDKLIAAARKRNPKCAHLIKSLKDVELFGNYPDGSEEPKSLQRSSLDMIHNGNYHIALRRGSWNFW